MTRIALGVEYLGTGFAGWQSQRGLPTIEAALCDALSRVADEPVDLICGGRTDAGVHALGQVVHFDSTRARSLRAWSFGANALLPPTIAVRWAWPVPAHFHARFSALQRRYGYSIFNGTARSAFAAGRAAWIRAPLDLERMRAAGAQLIGEHDFSAFRAAECQSRSPVRHVAAIGIEREGEWVRIDVAANAFLHHMVRNMVGLLIDVGRGDAPPERATRVLASRDRRQGSATAPAEGLCLQRIVYPAAFELPVPAGAGGPPV